jgi:hypothetical protein
MGLSISHNTWDGSSTSFNDFRRELVYAYNGTDLFDYAGYGYRKYKDKFSNISSPNIPLENIKDDGLYILINHADNEGDIRWVDCKLVADSLIKLLPKLNDEGYSSGFSTKERAEQFIKGCLLAYERKEDLIFI